MVEKRIVAKAKPPKVNVPQEDAALLEVLKKSNAGAMLTSPEAAIYMRFSGLYGFRTVEKLTREGKLRSGKSGSMHIYNPKDLDAFMFTKGI